MLGDDPERDATTDGVLIGAAEAAHRRSRDARRRRAPGAPGELLVRGPEMFAGYLDPALDAAAFVDGGWFRTGDLATYDGEYLTIVDRLKDVIIRGGENVSAQEVEVVARHAPGGGRSRVRRGSRRGDGRSGVRVRDPATRGEHRRSTNCARTSSPPASPASSCPSGWKSATEFARTASGKVQKEPLRVELTTPDPFAE